MKKFFISIFNGFLGMLIFILIYLYSNYSFPIICIIIPFIINYFMKDKKYIIILKCLLVISISIFIILPILDIIKNNYEFSFKCFISYYKLYNMMHILNKNFILCFLFSLIGIVILNYNKKKLFIIGNILIIIIINISILYKIDDKFDVSYNTIYKNKTIKLNDDLNIYIPDYFKKRNNEYYSPDDMKNGSSNYSNSIIKYIYIMYLSNYQYKTYNKIKNEIKSNKNYRSLEIIDDNDNLLLIGENTLNNQIYYDYYIRNNDDTIYLRFITNYNNQLTKKAVKEIVESIL